MERLLSTDDTQQIVPCGASVAGVFFDLLYDFDRTIGEFGHFRFVLTEQLLLTGRRHALTSVEAVRQRVETGHRFASPVDLLAAIVAQIAATIERIVGEQADAIDQIEDTVLKALAPDDRARLGATRLTSVRIHRRLNGLRGVFRRILANPSEGLMSALCHAAGPLAQRLDEIDQEVIELRDRARLLQDEITIKLAEQTNRHLHVLSIVTTLLLPPSLVAGLFGMNVSGLPFAESGGGFWWASAVALAASAIAAWVLSAIGVFKGRRDG
jgi:zinc transporter